MPDSAADHTDYTDRETVFGVNPRFLRCVLSVLSVAVFSVIERAVGFACP